MGTFPSQAQLANLPLIESLYRSYLADPNSVDLSWRQFFEGVDFAGYFMKKESDASENPSNLQIFELIQAYRRYGHLQARFNPLEEFATKRNKGELRLTRLGFEESDLKKNFPTFGFCNKTEASLQEIIDALKAIYCGPIGFEYMDLDDFEMEKWIQKEIEPTLSFQFKLEEKKKILEYLNQSEIFEMFIHTKYVGQKRFSIEGGETLIPILAEMIAEGANGGIEEVVLGMAHRGRLNVLANIMKKPFSMIFQEFEDHLPLFGTGGDVKYHKGYSSEIELSNGKKVKLYLAANSSCLESVDPIVLGQARARQVMAKDEERKRVGAILIHGDAALAGQGVVYESLEFCRLPGYGTGGTIHIVVNNQIGYTTLPQDSRSTTYCTDIAKTFGAPVIHVNGEDPEACVFAARLAIQLKMKFQCDVFIDLNCYRKYGHNEGDEPGFTQPLQYRFIRSRKSIREMYLEQLMGEGVLERTMAEALEVQFRDTLTSAMNQAKAPPTSVIESTIREGVVFQPIETKMDRHSLIEVAQHISEIPQGFHLHPKIEKWANERLAAVQGDSEKPAIDWALAEALAFGTLLRQGKSIRLSGQDTARGTFSQRHAVWFDQENGNSYCPFSKFKARFDVYNSPLSEYAAMAFEYGYNAADPDRLVLWEAQYGDFVIGAEILIDHYLTAGEQKWTKFSNLVLLLPHGYEGGGPEHSSGRIERFLQLTANDNIQVVYPTTAAQYFHLLRRQALHVVQKPLIVFTPKGLLRSMASTSSLKQLMEDSFEEILDDVSAPPNPKRIVICTGKIYHEIVAARSSFPSTVILRIEQLYPLHIQKLEKLFAKYKTATECIWVQEEPENMGAWESLRATLQQIFPKITYNGRPRSGSTATGSLRIHLQEQKAILDRLKQ